MEQATSENNGYMNIKKGQVIEFGSYDGDKDKFNRKEPIERIVLDVDDEEGTALLLSKYCLEDLPYHEEWENATWENCTLRKWLNDEFYNEAFSVADKGKILLTTIENHDNPYYETSGGNDTKDRVFLLSYEDVLKSKYGFLEGESEHDVNRISALAKNRGIKASNSTEDGELSCDWWLRSPGAGSGDACIVSMIGQTSDRGSQIQLNKGVRPALYINLNS